MKRALITDRELEVLENDNESDSYRYKVRSTVRDRLERLNHELSRIEHADPELAEEIRDELGYDDTDEMMKELMAARRMLEDLHEQETGEDRDEQAVKQ